MKLGTTITENREKYDKAALLPKPLFALFNHAVGYATAFGMSLYPHTLESVVPHSSHRHGWHIHCKYVEDTITVELTGDVDAAKAWLVNGQGPGSLLSGKSDETADGSNTPANETIHENKTQLYSRHPLEVAISIRDTLSPASTSPGWASYRVSANRPF